MSKGGEFPDRLLKRRSFHCEAQSLLGRGRHLPERDVQAAHKLLFHGLLELAEQGREVVLRVEHDNRLHVQPELLPRDDFQEFFQRAHATRQGDAGIREFRHALLADVHALCDNEARHARGFWRP